MTTYDTLFQLTASKLGWKVSPLGELWWTDKQDGSDVIYVHARAANSPLRPKLIRRFIQFENSTKVKIFVSEDGNADKLTHFLESFKALTDKGKPPTNKILTDNSYYAYKTKLEKLIREFEFALETPSFPELEKSLLAQRIQQIQSKIRQTELTRQIELSDEAKEDARKREEATARVAEYAAKHKERMLEESDDELNKMIEFANKLKEAK